MKRDMDLWRKILLEVEAHDTFTDPFEIELEDYTTSQISYHTMQLHQAGLLDAKRFPAEFTEQDDWQPIALTPVGHDFLDAARNQTLWERGKKIAQEQAGVLTLEALKIGLALAVQRAFRQSDAG